MIVRWLSVDPLADKYPGWSPYNYCLNNPLKYVDPDGEDIKVSGDLQKAKNDIMELAGSNNSNFVTFDKNGNVGLSKDFQVTSGGGSELLYELVKCSDQYIYEVSSTTSATTSLGTQNFNLDDIRTTGVMSAVNGGFRNTLMKDRQPLMGDVHVAISPNLQVTQNGQAVPRTNIVYHEFKEAQIMLNEQVPRYNTAHDKASNSGTNRAKTDGLPAAGADGGKSLPLKRIN